ncbi:hypothetical protein BVRB_7g179710 isoform B [Beta vulgaris subsp. vulgaris]|uniref:Uncharacterized protein n=1 Tax=Beta vulgaris subsp. vulgaris TaxID=3555 RepID=A0A0J8E1K5_BETVV|nr:hypothetical protein BVRB_7g179710 isoform B [Beta vulgaris subsp. vulgaris]
MASITTSHEEAGTSNSTQSINIASLNLSTPPKRSTNITPCGEHERLDG